MELIYPTFEHKESFSNYFLEYKSDNLKHQQTYLDLYELGFTDYEAYIEKMENQREGKSLPDGWAPSHTLFLVDKNDVKGVIRIRMNLASEYLQQYIGHIGYDVKASERGKGYGHQILKLGLLKAKSLGLENILILCTEENLASRFIIEKNGGLYESTIVDPDGEALRRYWISLP